MVQYQASWENANLENTEEIYLEIVTNSSCNDSEGCPSRPGFSVECQDGKCVYLQQLDSALFSSVNNSFQGTIENFNREEIETLNLLVSRRVDQAACSYPCRWVQQKCVCPFGQLRY